MYKKTIKKGEREYFYYYTNIIKDVKVNDIFLRFNKNKKNKTGFHNLIIVSDKNPTSTQTKYKKLNLYKSFTIPNYFLTKLRSHNLVIALDLRSSVLHRHLGSNSSLVMDIPASASKERYLSNRIILADLFARGCFRNFDCSALIINKNLKIENEIKKIFRKTR